MMVPAKVDYAALAILELAAHAHRGRPVTVRELAESQQIPSQFLVQILQRLKTAGLVRSTRGASGGYLLARPADQISLWDVWSAMANQEQLEVAEQTDARRAILHSIWDGMHNQRRELLEATSIAELLARCKDNTDPMYFI